MYITIKAYHRKGLIPLLGMSRTVVACLMLAIIAASPGGTRASSGVSVVDKAPEEIAPVKAPFEMPQFNRPVFPARIFDIRDFGAVEGGKVKNTQAISKTIKAAKKAGDLARVAAEQGVGKDLARIWHAPPLSEKQTGQFI